MSSQGQAMVRISLLFDCIAPGSSNRDIAKCALVSQEWYQLFTPRLWRPVSKLQSKDYAKFGSHVQHVHAHQLQVMDQVLSSCHALKDVNLNFRNPRRDFDRFFPGLESVTTDLAVGTKSSLYERWWQRPEQTPNGFLSNTMSAREPC
ncbi:hypothetical protein BGZ82_011003 [Podila clonocystis]|nr:hypothetical protein BGZ82_011003 [Podila clonocystis]